MIEKRKYQSAILNSMAILPKIIYASSESDSDQYYATHFLAPDRFLYVEKNGKGTAFVSELEYSRAKREAKCKVELMPKPPAQKSKAKPKSISIIAQILKSQGIRKASAPYNFPLGLAQRLSSNGIKIDAKPTSPFFDNRAIKSKKEISCIAESQEYAQQAIELAMGIISHAIVDAETGKLLLEGKVLTSEELRGRMSAFLSKHGFEPNNPIVSCGKSTAYAHDNGFGPIFAHQPIIMDVFPRHATTRYFGDVTRTVVKGEPTKEFSRLYEAVRQAQEQALDLVCEGCTGDEIHNKVKSVFISAGFENTTGKNGAFGFTHSTGHGVGLDIHEEPRVASGCGPLKAGNVITIEPGLYYQKIGGARIEDTVVVTKKGCDNLTRLGKELTVL